MALPDIEQIFTSTPSTYTIPNNVGVLKTRLKCNKSTVLSKGGYYYIIPEIQYTKGSAGTDYLYLALNYNFNLVFTGGGETVPYKNSFTTTFPAFYTLTNNTWIEYPSIDFDAARILLSNSNTQYTITGIFTATASIKSTSSENTSSAVATIATFSSGYSSITTFPALPNIQNPINTSPYNETVTLKNAFDPVVFTGTFKGEKCVKVDLNIYENNTGTFVEKFTYDYSTNPLYNNDDFTLTASGIDWNDPFGKGYYWSLDLYEPLNEYPFTSQRYYFELYNPPVIVLNYDDATETEHTPVELVPEPSTEPSNVMTINSRTIDITLNSYFQSQNIGIKYYNFILYSPQSEKIKDVGNVYSSNISFDYKGFETSDNSYVLHLTVETKKNQVFNYKINISVDYVVVELETEITATPNENDNSIVIDFSNTGTTDSVPNYTNSSIPNPFVLTNIVNENNSNYSLDLATNGVSPIVYSQNIGQSPLRIDGKNFGFCVRTEWLLPNESIAKIYTDEYLYEIYTKNYYVYLRRFRYKYGGSPLDTPDFERNMYYYEEDEENTPSPFNPYFENGSTYAIYSGNRPTNQIFMWYNDNINVWRNDSNHSYAINTENDVRSCLSFYCFSVSYDDELQPNEPYTINYGSCSCWDWENNGYYTYNNDLNFGTYNPEFVAGQNKIEFGLNQKIDFFELNRSAYSPEEIQYIAPSTGEITNYWRYNYLWNEEYPVFNSDSILLMSNFTNTTLVDSTDGAYWQNVVGYQLYRREQGKTFSVLVGDFSASNLGANCFVSYENENGVYTHYRIFDNTAKSNTPYFYYIVPYGEIYDTDEARIEKYVIGDFTNYCLIPLQYDQSSKKYYIPSLVGENNTDTNFVQSYPFWVFSVDREEPAITTNQDKTVFTTFGEKPKIVAGALNYDTGSITVKLGNMFYNIPNADKDCYKYYEPHTTLELWKDFVRQNPICLLKNPKGDVKIVSIDPNTTREYMNETAYRYSNWGEDDNSIPYNNATVYPTEITFNYTEIEEVSPQTLMTTAGYITD